MEKHCKRISSLVFALLENLLYSGTIFGWPFFAQMLTREGYYKDLCVSTNVTRATASSNTTRPTETMCLKQAEHLNLIYSVSVVSYIIFCLVAGYLLDKLGTWVCKTLSTMLLIVSLVLLAQISPGNLEVLLFPAMICMSVSNAWVYMTNFQFANLFRSARSVIVLTLTATLLSSSFVFWLFSLAPGISLKLLCYIYATPAIGFVLIFPFFAPRTRIPYPLPRNFEYGIRMRKGALLLTDCKVVQDVTAPAIGRLKIFSALGMLLFATNLFQFSVMNLRNLSFLGVFDTWVHTFPGTESDVLTVGFGIVCTFGGIVTPLVGLVDDLSVRYYRKRRQISPEIARLKSANALTLVSCAIGITLSVCIVIPVSRLQFVTFMLLQASRSATYSSAYVSISILYPPERVATLVGLLYALGGGVTLLQYPLYRFVLRSCKGSFLVVDLILVGFAVLSLVNPVVLYATHRKVAKLVMAPILRELDE